MMDYRILAIDFDDFPKEMRRSFEASPFASTFTQTMEVLERETRHLRARSGSLVIKTFHRPSEVKSNGKLRADVRKPIYPGVIVWFEALQPKARRYDPMQFECDKYSDWKSNLRAIALAMEKLRAVDRYEVSSRGKEDAHTAGYKALPAAESETATANGDITPEQAAATLYKIYPNYLPEQILLHREVFERVRKVAVRRVHPDTGGTHDAACDANRAVEVLREYWSERKLA